MCPHLVCRSCPIILPPFLPLKRTSTTANPSVLVRVDYIILFCVPVVRFSQFFDAAFVVNNFMWPFFDWLDFGGVSLPCKLKTIYWIYNSLFVCRLFLKCRKHFRSSTKKNHRSWQIFLYPKIPGRNPLTWSTFNFRFRLNFLLTKLNNNTFIWHSSHENQPVFFIVAIVYKQFCLYRFLDNWLNDKRLKLLILGINSKLSDSNRGHLLTSQKLFFPHFVWIVRFLCTPAS